MLFQHWQVVYMVLLAMLALVSMFTQLHPQFLSAKWHLRRLFLYSALIFAEDGNGVQGSQLSEHADQSKHCQQHHVITNLPVLESQHFAEKLVTKALQH